MTRIRNIFFEEQSGVTEVIPGQVFHRFVCTAQLIPVPAQSHAYSAAPGGAFQHHRISDMCSLTKSVLHVSEQAGTGEQRQIILRSQFPCCMLQAEIPHLARAWADKIYTVRAALL